MVLPQDQSPEDVEPPLVLQQGDPVVQVHSRFNQFLLPYQREGVRWLFEAVRGNRGAILGDDMGLGKTVQMLALLSAVLFKHGTAKADKRRKSDQSPGPVLVLDMTDMECG
ncbi:hypothetical protein DYB37_008520 [Aphanomyces astaci]|uniref:SNF2 N-terminal domain-containing protein n=1 Tax=Aphanomyces astaci TaxID=112090 RepID=A0A397CSK5_APHAT|nr:hypothetical protein DYB30_012689 [Aphanomyces astaci]RHZ02533.1 hypothetical protein DYB35_012794 [Aphanomyces astaci]RHZ16303.1 hypothetical protein DYB37_008520 [Aphanomyces astaci]RLO13813.1 hypothetical protein DYB28_003106 [Aphanomyces astaci]